MSGLLIVFGIAALAVAGFYVWYATIITRRNRMQEALSGIDVQLKKRLDLIPNLLTMVQRGMEYEEAVLSDVTKLRSEAVRMQDARDANSLQHRFEVEGALGAKMSDLMIQVEAYPELKAEAAMRDAMDAWEEVEENIAAARRFFNSSVGDLKNAVEIFPGTVINGLVGAEVLPFFEVEERAREPISAGDYLKPRG